MVWLKTLLFAVLVPGTVVGLVPYLLVARGRIARRAPDEWRWLGLLPLAAGIVLMLWCFGAFARIGRGTPAPVDAPRRLVVRGAYRVVRNPMYVGALLILVGEALFWQAPGLVLYAAAFWLACHLFVVGYEERSLGRRFGDDYAGYRATVPRWLPSWPGRERHGASNHQRAEGAGGGQR
jgi:protein-S-isoprenylcysteine O-methyltransferase Ste14